MQSTQSERRYGEWLRPPSSQSINKKIERANGRNGILDETHGFVEDVADSIDENQRRFGFVQMGGHRAD